jgi:glucose/arabinose dehydrogenase/azurin
MGRPNSGARGLAALALALVAAPIAPLAGQDMEAVEPNRGGEITLETQDPAVALQQLHTAPGYRVNLFASEQDFPVENAVAIQFDSRGRMWVATMPTYPHVRPGEPATDKLVILEDTNGDGIADRHTVFADSLYLATGFELGDGGVYVAQQPNLVFLRDTNGDGVADERRIIHHGFGTGDSHHSIHAFTWGPDGALYFQEGTFHYTQTETPYGPIRVRDAGIFRYEPRTEKLEVFVSYPFANPWGHVFDRWGQNFIADASNGNNYFALPLTGRVEYPRKRPEMQVFTTKVRPTGGAELISSRHLPADVQGNFIVSNSIGFHGIKNHRVFEESSGFSSTEAEPLLYSTDINFRPIDIKVGPDGALYIVDWYNPLVGHMQYSLRDPRRDHTHGRIWRLSAENMPLLEVKNLELLSVPQLLDELKVYEDRHRYRVRRELRERGEAEVRSALAAWVRGLDTSDPEHEHHLLEALWQYQALNVVERQLLDRLLNAEDPRARAAATRVLRFWRDQLDDSMELFRARVNDEHPRVRLEAVIALSYVPTVEAARVALESRKHATDYYLDYGLTETIAALEPQWKPVLLSGEPFAADNPDGVVFLLDRLSAEELPRVALTEPVARVLLERSGVALDARRAALSSLAQQRRTTAAAILTQTLTTNLERPHEPAAKDLATLLAESPGAELRAQRSALERLARSAADPLLRQGAFLGLMRADGNVDRAWRLAAASRRGMLDLLEAAGAVEDPALQQALYPRIRAFLDETLSRPAASTAEPVRGRYVRIEQPGCCETQSLAEVQVFDGTRNVALTGRATQKSTGSGGLASRAIDGVTDGDFRLGSVSQSAVLEADPWWELDLQESRPISSIVIWKRTDGQLGGDMNGFHVRVLDAERRPVFTRENNDAEPQPIVFSVDADTARLVRRAAVRALSELEGNEEQRLALFTDLLARGVESDLALAGAATIAGTRAPAEAQAGALVDRVLAHAQAMPIAEREGDTFKRAIELARALGATLPADRAERITARIEGLLPKQVRIRALDAQMRFDVEYFVVQAGQQVEIVLENPDHMPHNLVVTLPGAAEKVGRAADAMAAQPDGFAKEFIPDLPEVYAATRLINTGQSYTLRFEAPSAPGEYPFICTFPGHWITMRGIMNVTPAATE